MSIVFCNLRNQLDVFLPDLCVFTLVRVSDVFAVDEEHRDLDLTRNAFYEFFLVFKLLVDVVTNHHWGSRDLALSLFCEFCNIFVWIEVVLRIKRSVGLDILCEGQDGPLQVGNKVLKCVVKPGILIQKLCFVVRVRRKRLIRWNYRSLNCPKNLRLEELFEKHLLKMRNLLQTFDSIFEDLFDLGNNLLRVVIVLRHQLVCFADQIKLEQGIRVLVFRKLFVDLFFYLNCPREVVYVDRNVTVRLFLIFFLFLAISAFLGEFVSND